MQRWFVFALAAIPIALVSLRPATPAMEWWVVDGLEKVRPLDPIPDKPQSSVHLFAARNEFEPFQIILRGEGQETHDVDVGVSELRAASGAVIPKEAVSVY